MIINLARRSGYVYVRFSFICIFLLTITGCFTKLFSQGIGKNFESDSLAESSIIELLAGKEDTTVAFLRDFFSNEFTFLNTTYHGSFELKGAVNKRGLRTGVWEIYRITTHQRRMLLAKGRYLPLSPSRVILDSVLFVKMAQSEKDSLRLQFWMATDFNAINFPEGQWYFFTFSNKITKEYQLNATYIMASFIKVSYPAVINLQPFDFLSLLDGVQKVYNDDGGLTDSSFYKKYYSAVTYNFNPSDHNITKKNIMLLTMTSDCLKKWARQIAAG